MRWQLGRWVVQRRGGSTAAAGAASGASSTELKGTGKVIIGGFEDGAMDPLKNVILPLFEKETGIKVEFLLEPYDSFFSKAFQDGTSKSGQFDIYIMDDPWIPQYAAGGVLEPLEQYGLTAEDVYPAPFIDLGFWPPKSGPRVKGFENQEPTLVALPTIGDLQTLTYRNDVFTNGAPKTYDEFVQIAGDAQKAGKIKYGYVFRGVKGNPIVGSWWPVMQSYGADMFDDKWEPIFNSAEGKASAAFLLRPAEGDRPARRRRVQLRPGGRGHPRWRRRGRHPVLRRGHQVGRPGPVEGRRQARLRRHARRRRRPSRSSASSSTASRRGRRTRTTRSSSASGSRRTGSRSSWPAPATCR